MKKLILASIAAAVLGVSLNVVAAMSLTKVNGTLVSKPSQAPTIDISSEQFREIFNNPSQEGLFVTIPGKGNYGCVKEQTALVEHGVTTIPATAMIVRASNGNNTANEVDATHQNSADMENVVSSNVDPFPNIATNIVYCNQEDDLNLSNVVFK